MIKLDKAQELIARDSQVYSQIGRIPYVPLVVKKAHGATLVDADGNKYIDLIAAASSLNTGSNHPRVIQAIKGQSKGNWRTASIIRRGTAITNQ